MLTIYRRHAATCRHKSRHERRCQCPVWAQGTIGGRKIRQSLDLTSWEAATALVHTWETSGRFGSATRDVPSLEKAIDGYLDDCVARSLSDATVRKSKRTLRGQLLPFLERRGVRTIEGVTVDDLRAFRSALADAPNTQAKKVERLRAFFRFCVDSDWIKRNPAKAIALPRLRLAPTLPFTSQEFECILAACDRLAVERRFSETNVARLRALVVLMRYAGLRIQDAVCLPRAALRPDGSIFLYTQKTGVAVVVPVPPLVVATLNGIQAASDRHFFWSGGSKRTSPTGHYQRRLQQLFELAGIEGGHSHRFRDTFAVSLLEKGVPLEQVSILLGHSSIKITEKHYAPWVRSRQARLEELVRSTWETLGTFQVRDDDRSR